MDVKALVQSAPLPVPVAPERTYPALLVASGQAALEIIGTVRNKSAVKRALLLNKLRANRSMSPPSAELIVDYRGHDTSVTPRLRGPQWTSGRFPVNSPKEYVSHKLDRRST